MTARIGRLSSVLVQHTCLLVLVPRCDAISAHILEPCSSISLDSCTSSCAEEVWAGQRGQQRVSTLRRSGRVSRSCGVRDWRRRRPAALSPPRSSGQPRTSFVQGLPTGIAAGLERVWPGED